MEAGGFEKDMRQNKSVSGFVGVYFQVPVPPKLTIDPWSHQKGKAVFQGQPGSFWEFELVLLGSGNPTLVVWIVVEGRRDAVPNTPNQQSKPPIRGKLNIDPTFVC